MRLAVVNLKGGTGKTTTAMLLATALGERGRTLLVDADPQGSALSWSEQAVKLPFSVIGLPVKDVHLRLPEIGQGYEFIVVDTPPGDASIVRSSLLAVSHALLPIPPALIDLDRLRPTMELIAEAEAHNPNLSVSVVLTKVRRGTRSAKGAREVLVDLDMPVLSTEIPLKESYAAAFGEVPHRVGEYTVVLDELMKTEVA